MLRARLAFALPLLLALGGCAVDAQSTADGDDVSEAVVQASPIANFHKVRKGLFRGGHPDKAGITYLKSIGVKTIVDLEIADLIEATPGSINQELGDAAAAGIPVLRFPMSAFEPAVSARFDQQMDQVLAVLADPKRQPIYVHCKHGQDRTGLVVALERVQVEKWAPQKAHDEMLSLGFHTIFVGLDEYFERKTGWQD